MCRQLLQKNKNLQRKIEKNMLRKLVQAETHKTQLAFGIVPRASFSSAKPALAWDHFSGRRHVHQQIDNTVGVAPLIVIPGHKLYEGWREHDTCFSIKNSGACLTDKVR
mmetsp:Transcript_110309/g.206745  ORF Transcript_110309/g.206745 Transcript_110309/m.206745 type:complete len:109 (-) Transcript_110309:353-679(-)